MNHTFRILLSVTALLFASCSSSPRLAPVTREFLSVPDHYLGNLSHPDRQLWLQQTAGDSRIVNDRNLNFSYDGESPLSGEAPLTFHLFSSAGNTTVGIFIERFYNTRNRKPPSTLHILTRDDSRWTDVTEQVFPKPFNPHLCYEFSPSSDTITVREYTYSKKGDIEPGRQLERLMWTGHSFTKVRN